jgi:hypothetical protein
MRKAFLGACLVAAISMAAIFASVSTTDAAFHIMRIYNVMGGSGGDPNVQLVELRMADPGQNLVGTHVLCFFDASGAPYARATFPMNVGNAVDEASILFGSAEFDAVWAAGSPDFTFSSANTTAIAPGADVNHPVRAPAGKIIFGSDSASTPALMCQAGLNLIVDSVAYGTGYTGTVDLGTRFNTNLPTSSTNGMRLQGSVCHPGSFSSACGTPPDNSVNYAIADENASGNQPRNNSSQSGPLAAPDADGDGVADSTDNCPAWPNAGQGMPSWTVPAGDSDCDGWPDSVAAGGRVPESFLGTASTSHCAATSNANDEALPDAWPVDFNDDQLTNGQDILKYNPKFGTFAPGGPAPNQYSVRFDLNADDLINGQDILKFNSFFGRFCV